MAFSLVQEAHNFSYTTGIPVLTLSTSITKGNLLVAWCTSTDSTSANTPWADAGYDLTWIPVVQQVYTGGYGYLSAWYTIAKRTRSASVQFFGSRNPVASGGNGAVPANLTQPACQVLEFSGNGQIPLLAFHAASGTDTSPRSSVTAGSGVGLLVGISVPPTTTNLATETTGWTNAAGASIGSSAIYALESGAGTYTPTFSIASSAEWGALALAFALPASTSTISGSIGKSGNVQFIAQTTLIRQSATTDGVGNYTSPSLENDTYTVIPQAVGAYYSPYSVSQAISGSNITGLNFSPVSVNTALPFVTHWVDTMTRANENPLSDGGYWHIDGTPIPPWDPPLQLLSNKGTFADITIYSNLAGPWKADAISIWILGNGVPNDQWMELQIDALNADPLSYATAYLQVRSDNADEFCYRLAVQNNGDGTATLALISNPFNSSGIPADWEFNGHQNYGIVTADVPFSLGDTIRFAIVGSVLYMYHNEVLVGTASDTNISSGTFCIELTGKATSDVQVSHFLGGTFSTMPTYTQLATDTFSRTLEDPLSDGGNWAVPDATNHLTLSSANEVNGATGNVCMQYFNGSISWPNDQYSEVTVTSGLTTSSQVGPGVRCQVGARNGYVLFITGTGAGAPWYIQKQVSGTGSILAQGTFTYAGGDVLRLEVQGTTLTAKHNGTVLGTATDSTYTSGFPGLGTFADFIPAGFAGPWNGGSITIPASGSSASAISSIGLLQALQKLNF